MSKKDKAGTVYLDSYHEAIRPLSDSDRLLMYDTIFDYGTFGTMPENLPPHIQGYWVLIKPNIDASKNRYAAAVQNGKKGGRPPKDPSPPTLKSEFNQSLTEAKPEPKLSPELEELQELRDEKRRQMLQENPD